MRERAIPLGAERRRKRYEHVTWHVGDCPLDRGAKSALARA